MTPPARVLLAWSSGKDSAFTLHVLRSQGVEVVGLLTTINEAFDRVAMHAVRLELLRAQADAVGLPLLEVRIPWPCPSMASSALSSSSGCAVVSMNVAMVFSLRMARLSAAASECSATGCTRNCAGREILRNRTSARARGPKRVISFIASTNNRARLRQGSGGQARKTD